MGSCPETHNDPNLIPPDLEMMFLVSFLRYFFHGNLLNFKPGKEKTLK